MEGNIIANELENLGVAKDYEIALNSPSPTISELKNTNEKEDFARPLRLFHSSNSVARDNEK